MTSSLSPILAAPHGMLFVAADVDPKDDADFNRWYDREHVEERARIAGFLSGARYRARAGSAPGARKYLGLYRTASLAAFTSSAYQAAFERQTPWSVRNLDRMRDPMRRVCAVQAVTGVGSGCRLAILPLAAEGDPAALVARTAEAARQWRELPGFVQSYLLVPDAALSTPLPREATDGRALFPMLVLETSTEAPALLAQAARRMEADLAQAWLYEMGWKLTAAELAATL